MTTLAIDLGTSAIKIMRVDTSHQIVGVDRIPVSGLNVRTWLEALRKNLHQHGDGSSIERLAITGQMHGLITLEDTGYGEGIPWTDQRGASLVSWLDEGFTPDISMRIGGPLASGFQFVSLIWVRSSEPGRWERIQNVMLPKDAFIHALTGQHVTDPSDAAGTGMFDVEEGTWSWELVDSLNIPHDWLPQIVPSGSNVGSILPEVAQHLGLRPDTHVIIAGGDAPVGAVGAGVTRPGQALIILSSGAQIILPSATHEPDADGRWYSWPAAASPGGLSARYLRVGTLLNAGTATTWLREILAGAETIAAVPTNLIALPHLIGERSPIRDADARGAIIGITPETTAAELTRAMLEGIAYALRHALDVMCENIPRPAMIRLGGGGAHNDIWQAMISNVLGIPTGKVCTSELSAYGAALLAAKSPLRTPGPCGQFASPSPAHPDPKLVAHYDVRYAIYRDALDAITPISHRLARLKRE